MPAVERVLDANLNRAREGLRVLEEVARFLLDDAALSARLKALRHQLASRDPQARRTLISARKAAGDVGAALDLASEGERRSIVEVVAANAGRVQESLRVLEEFSKLAETSSLPLTDFKAARFALYDLDRELSSRLLRQERAQAVRGLYVIIDPAFGGGRSAEDLAAQALAGGARVIQLRDKLRKKGQLLPVARAIRRLCQDAGAIFIVNDDVDLTIACDADGLHLGQKDLPLPVARSMLPIDTIVGVSTATVDEAVAAQADGADYVAVGSIYPTASKSDTRSAGLETLRRVAAAVSRPIVAIGGISEVNVAPVLQAGANGVAVISAVIGAADVTAAARRLVACLEIEAEADSPGRKE